MVGCELCCHEISWNKRHECCKHSNSILSLPFPIPSEEFLEICHDATIQLTFVYFAGSLRVARSVPTIVFPVNPPASTALR